MAALVEIVSPSSPFRCGTKISEDLFVQELDKKGSFDSPLFEDETDPETLARLIFRYIVEHGHSAEVWLAIAGKEHTWGTASDSVLRRNHTKSWGNTKSIVHPQVTGREIFDPVRRSRFIAYDNLMGSVMDCVYRVDSPTYSYAGKVTIAEVIKVWAPREDSNDPEGYAWWVANYVNGLRGREIAAAPGGDSHLVPWVPADGRHFTKGRAGVTWPDILIQHHTDGWDSLYWLTESPNSDVSATYLANHDGSLRAQLVRHKDTPHTTGYMNPRSISMEWERKWTGTTDQRYISDSQYVKLAKSWALIVTIESQRGNPHFTREGKPWLEPAQLRDHNDFFDTVCPGNLDVTRLYPLIIAELTAQQGTTDLVIEGNPFGAVPIKLGFKDHFLERGANNFPEDPIRGGLAIFGYPMEEEYETEFGSAQKFERYVMEWHRDADEPWDIVGTIRGRAIPPAKGKAV